MTKPTLQQGGQGCSGVTTLEKYLGSEIDRPYTQSKYGD